MAFRIVSKFRERKRMGKRHTVFVALATFMFGATAIGQNVSLSTIDGTVTDPSGAAIPGTSVTATSSALQVGTVSVTADKDGAYRLTELPLGEYVLRFEHEGFETLIRPGIVLDAGFTMKLDASMKVGAASQSVTVTADVPVVDTQTTSGGQTVDTNLTDTLLPASKTAADIIAMTPGLNSTAGQDPGVLGQNARPRFNMYGVASGNTNLTMMVDGFPIIANNPVPDVGTTQETDVKTFGNGAEVKEVGSAINLVLKSGGNDFHGSVSSAFSFQPGGNITPLLISRGISTSTGIRGIPNDFSGDLGGRIIKNKLWFYGSARRRDSQISDAGLINAGGTPVYPHQFANNYLVKLSYLITPKYTLSAVGTWDNNHSDADLQAQSFVFTPYNSTSTFNWNPYNRKVELQGTPRPNLIFDIQFGKSQYDLNRAQQPGCDNQPSTYDETSGYYGGCRYAQYGDSQFLSWNGTANVTYMPASFLGGHHEFKVGYQFIQRHTGSIRPEEPFGDYELVFETIGNVPHQPLEIIFAEAPADPKDWDVTESVYLTDQWRVGKRLTFNFGMRLDHQHSYIPAQTFPGGALAPALFPATNYAALDVGSWNRLAPRAAVAWDLNGKGTTVVKVSYGFFNAEDDLANSYDPASSYTETFRWHDLAHNGLYGSGDVNFAPNGPDYISSTQPSPIINPNLKLPYSQQAVATVERQIGKGMAFRVLYMQLRDGNDTATENIARPYSDYTFSTQREVPNSNGTLPALCPTCAVGKPGSLIAVYDYTAASAGAAFTENVVENVPAGRSYRNQSLESAFNQRLGRRWTVQSSFTGTKNHRYLNEYIANPNQNYFDLDTTWSWIAELSASYRLPHGVIVGTIMSIVSGLYGQPTYAFRAADPLSGPSLPESTSVTIPLAPFGSIQEAPQPTLNFRAGKTWTLREKKTFEAAFDVLNVGDASTIRAATYVYGPTYGTVTDLLPPRQFKGTVSFRF